jgi:hypothetical protein
VTRSTTAACSAPSVGRSVGGDFRLFFLLGDVIRRAGRFSPDAYAIATARIAYSLGCCGAVKSADMDMTTLLTPMTM